MDPSSSTRDVEGPLPPTMPLLVIRGRCLFPGGLLRLSVGKPRSIKLIEDFLLGQKRPNPLTHPHHQPAYHQQHGRGGLIAVVALRPGANDEAASASAAGSGAGGGSGGGGGADSSNAVVGTRGERRWKVPEAAPFDDPPVYAVGCAAKVVQVARGTATGHPDAFHFSVLVQGVARIRLEEVVAQQPFYVARVSRLPDIGRLSDPAVKALAINLREATQELHRALRSRATANTTGSSSSSSSSATGRGPAGGPHLPSAREVAESIQNASPVTLADELVTHLGVSLEEKQAILAEARLEERLRGALEMIKEQVQVIQLSSSIKTQVEDRLSSKQREYYLRQQLKAIKDQLGEADEGGAEEDDLVEVALRLRAKDLPPEVRAAAEKELRRLKRMQPSQPEVSSLRNYLDWVLDLPWTAKAARVTSKLPPLKALKDDGRGRGHGHGKGGGDKDEEEEEEDEEEEGVFDVAAVEAQLEKDHYGLGKVKRRILEYIAVRSLTKSLKGPILCLVGPPGVGKTSLGRSIATALGRRFQRLSLGGVHDEAEVRGHRRTYIGALPGRIVESMKKAGRHDPLILLDEIDKLGTSVRGGDPSAALLEVLDPEQNHTFTDHYMSLPLDLSHVFFLATANQTDTIPEPLLDRMELITLPGYTIEEKVHIAERYLVPKQLKNHGLSAGDHLLVTPRALQLLATGYTREAGVRQLEREIAAVCRNVAMRVAAAAPARRVKRRGKEVRGRGQQAERDDEVEQGMVAMPQQEEDEEDEENDEQEEEEELAAASFSRVVVTPEQLEEMLGPVRYESEIAARLSVPGVVTGLAWKATGGELLFIECSLVPGGRGALTITGKLGEVMKESATLAMTWLKAQMGGNGNGNGGNGGNGVLERLVGRPQAVLDSRTDVHIHVPAGAIPKDGPSAGVAMTVALVSLVTGRRVKPTVAMTGEMTLRGLVLPVGGVKEKLLAAHRGGIRHVILPRRNEKDLQDLPSNVRDDLAVTLCERIDDALAVAFEPLSPFDAAAPAAMDDGGGLRGGGNTSSSSSGGGNGAGGGNGGNIRVPPAPPMAAAAAQQQQQQRRLQTELEEEQDDANVSPYHPFFSRMPGDYRAAPPENKGGGGGGGVDLCGPVSRSML